MMVLRKRLLAWQAAAMLAAVLVAAVLGYAMAWRGFNAVRDHGLEQVAYAIVRHGLDSKGADSARPVPLRNTDPDLGQFISQIWDRGGILRYASSELLGPPEQVDGFSDVWWHDQEWRVFSVMASGQRVQVAVAVARRVDGFERLLPWLTGLILLVLCLLLLLSHMAVKLAILPLQRLRSDLESRDPHALSPIETAHMPDEVQTLGLAFNHLLLRLRSVLEEQRQFMSDAAHGLNTPLAALKLRAQILRLIPPDKWPQAVDELNEGVDRTVRLVIQLLRLVRIAPEWPADSVRAVDLAGLVQQVLDEVTPSAALTGHVVQWQVPATSVRLIGDATGLRVLIENLLGNALAYTPAGTDIRIELHAQQDRVELHVIDRGPGIDDDQKPRALARFVRLTPSDGKGSGLGLAISQAVARQHGGDIELRDTPGGGLTVVVWFSGISVRG